MIGNFPRQTITPGPFSPSHAEAAVQHALNGGKDNPHVDEGIAHLKAAIEHGKAGHADVATKHAETAVMHQSQERKLR